MAPFSTPARTANASGGRPLDPFVNVAWVAGLAESRLFFADSSRALAACTAPPRPPRQAGGGGSSSVGITIVVLEAVTSRRQRCRLRPSVSNVLHGVGSAHGAIGDRLGAGGREGVELRIHPLATGLALLLEQFLLANHLFLGHLTVGTAALRVDLAPPVVAEHPLPPHDPPRALRLVPPQGLQRHVGVNQPGGRLEPLLLVEVRDGAAGGDALGQAVDLARQGPAPCD